jgi:DNA invertase Pin-like site-specific DNA recombinase
MKYVAYGRTSTAKQDNGIEVQVQALEQYNPVAWFIEQESGKNKERPQLLAALEYCKVHDCTLLFYKIDRLARDAEYALKIKNSGVPLHCHTMPEINTMVFGIFAIIAQDEAENISRRTKESLNILKQKGVALGYYSHEVPLPPEHFEKMRERSLAVRRLRVKEKLAPQIRLIKRFKESGMSLVEIADELNALGMRTSKGKEFLPMSVKRLCSLA